MFIALEGINGCGKTTVAALVAKKLTERVRNPLRPEEVVVMRNPSPGPIGMEIRRYLRDARRAGFPMFFSKDAEDFARHLAILFIADRLAMQAELDEHLAAERTVICDRYSVSTLIYQCAMIGDITMTSRLAEMIRDAHKGMTTPTCTFILDAPVEAARIRLVNRGEDIDDLMMAPIEHAVRAMYRDFRRTNYNGDGGQLLGIGDVSMLEAGDPDEIATKIADDASEIPW